MCSDLFCAFQPKRLMVPSLPLWLKSPAIPKLLLRLAFRLASRVESSRFSSSPVPNSGVGMRKVRLLAAAAAAKLGCCRLQPVPPSGRPLTVNSASTPPFGLAVFTVPFALKKNGKRASRVGPVAVMKDGVVFVVLQAMAFTPSSACVCATPLAQFPTTLNSGLLAGPVPPIAGCEWHPEHWLKLNRGPRPLAGPPFTDSTS